MTKVATRYDVTDCTTPEQLLAKCGLNWEPEVRKAGYDTGNSNFAGNGSDKFRAIVNPLTGNALAYTGTRFKPNSHVKAVNDVWGLVKAGNVVPQNVSVWDGGGRIALQFRAPDLDVKVGPKSIISPLLTLVVNHDATSSDRGFFADFDYWCKNQAGIVAKIQGDGVRHSSGIIANYEALLEDRIRSVRGNMGDRYQTMQRMAEVTIHDGGARPPLLRSYFRKALNLQPPTNDAELKHHDRILADVFAAHAADDHGVKDSVWHAYSAVTRYTTHTEGRNEATRMQRALLGSQDRYVRAFSEAAQLVS